MSTSHRYRAAAVLRRGRQVGADTASRLAPRCDGRPDPGQRPDPRGHYGHGRRVHDRALQSDLRSVADSHASSRSPARLQPCLRPLSRSYKTTSSESSPIRHAASLGTCSLPAVSALMARAFFIFTRTHFSRPCSSWARAA